MAAPQTASQAVQAVLNLFVCFDETRERVASVTPNLVRFLRVGLHCGVHAAGARAPAPSAGPQRPSLGGVTRRVARYG